jgi:hypothetical protein
MQEYKVYAIMRQMFDPNFMNNLQQVPSNNLWLLELTNRNYKTRVLH